MYDQLKYLMNDKLLTVFIKDGEEDVGRIYAINQLKKTVDIQTLTGEIVVDVNWSDVHGS